MKSLFILLIAGATGLTAFAQEDTKAKDILDKLSTKTKAYKTIKADFQFTMANKAEGTNESQSGKIEIKGDKYILSISGQDVISDGQNMWTILKESKEVQINEIDEEDEEVISPNKIFTLYEEGFKYKCNNRGCEVEYGFTKKNSIRNIFYKVPNHEKIKTNISKTNTEINREELLNAFGFENV